MINAAFELRSKFYQSIAISFFSEKSDSNGPKIDGLKPTLLIRLTGIFCFTVNRGCAVGADSLNGKKRLLSDVVAAGGGTCSFVPFIYYFLAREQAPIIDPAARLFLRLSKRG